MNLTLHTLSARGDADFDLYPYIPSAALGYAFLVLFSLGGLAHLGYLFFLRTWYFFPFILGCAGKHYFSPLALLSSSNHPSTSEGNKALILSPGEAGGYYGRAWSHSDIRNGSPYLIQLMLILASAPLLSATIYMTLSRYIRALDATNYALLRPSWTTAIYICIDVISFVCQMAGSAMQASGDAAGIETGNRVVMGGLGFQLAAFVVFVGMAAVVHVRLNRSPTTTSSRVYVRWRRYFWSLYLVSLLVFVRSLFRLIEFCQGSNGTIYKSEAYLYVFDGGLMWCVVVTMLVVHPGMLLRSVRKVDVGCMVEEMSSDGEEGMAIVSRK